MARALRGMGGPDGFAGGGKGAAPLSRDSVALVLAADPRVGGIAGLVARVLGAA